MMEQYRSAYDNNNKKKKKNTLNQYAQINNQNKNNTTTPVSNSPIQAGNVSNPNSSMYDAYKNLVANYQNASANLYQSKEQAQKYAVYQNAARGISGQGVAQSIGAGINNAFISNKNALDINTQNEINSLNKTNDDYVYQDAHSMLENATSEEELNKIYNQYKDLMGTYNASKLQSEYELQLNSIKSVDEEMFKKQLGIDDNITKTISIEQINEMAPNKLSDLFGEYDYDEKWGATSRMNHISTALGIEIDNPRSKQETYNAVLKYALDNGDIKDGQLLNTNAGKNAKNNQGWYIYKNGNFYKISNDVAQAYIQQGNQNWDMQKYITNIASQLIKR